MILYFRLLAGLTSLSEARCESHFFSMGPGGTLDSSCISLGQHAGLNENGNQRKAERQHDGHDHRTALERRRIPGMADPDRLKHAPEAMIEMERKEDHCDDVGCGCAGLLKAGHQVVVDIQ